MSQADAVVHPTRPALRPPFAKLKLSAPSRLDVISPIVERLQSFIAQFLPDRNEVDDIREALVNAVYWSLRMEKKIPAKSAVDFVGEFKPTPFRFRTMPEWKPGLTPADLRR